jgi:hypothetical protein
VKRKLLGFTASLFLVLLLLIGAASAYIVTGTSTATAIDYPFQRKIFYANGRFWVWDTDGTYLEYGTSTDGSSWTSVDVRACTLGSQFSIWFDGTYVHYAVASGNYIYYRRGAPNSDGSITWSATEQTISLTYGSSYRPFISVDSNGYPWIVYYSYSNSPYPLVAIKSSKNDGTWTTESTTTLTAATSGNTMCGAIVPLTNGKMLALYTNDGVAVSAKYWSGSAWGTAVSTTSTVQYAYEFSAVAQGDYVHLVFLKATTYDILYMKYNYSSNSFSAETTLVSGATALSAPVISINPAANDLYVFATTKTGGQPSGWTANHVYCINYTASSGTWGSWVDWFTPSNTLYSADKITSAYSSSYNIGFACLTSTAAPYFIEFSYVSFNTPPNAPTLNSPAASCHFNPGASVAFSWTFSDNDTGDSQSAYQLQIGNSGFTTIYLDTGKVSSTAQNATQTLPSNMTVGVYYWRVTTWDSLAEGAWSTGRAIIVDRLAVTITANTTNPEPNAYVDFTVTAKYEYDNAPVASWTVNVCRNSTHFATGNFTDGGYSDTLYLYTVENVTENVYGLTAFTSNTVTVYWSTYVALTVQTKDLDNNILTGAIVYFNETEVPVDSQGYAIKTDIVQYNVLAVKVKWQGLWVNGTWTINMTTTKTIEAICNVWSLTFNLKDSSGVALTASPAQVYYTFPNGSTCMVLNTTTGSGAFKVANGTSYYMVKFQDVWVTANTTLADLSPSTTLVSVTCNVYKLTVYVQSQETGQAVLGAGLVLKRVEDSVITTLNGLYGLPASPVTGEYNFTHARYIWPQLAMQNSSYVIYVYLYSEQRGGATTELTANTETFIVISSAAPPPSPGPGPSLGLDFRVEDTYLTVTKGETTSFNISIVWSNTAIITISKIQFQDRSDWFTIVDELPKTVYKPSGFMPEGTATVAVRVTVPWDQQEGTVTLNVVVTCPSPGGMVERSGVIYLTVTGKRLAQPGSIPEYMTYVFLFGLLLISVYAFAKKR